MIVLEALGGLMVAIVLAAGTVVVFTWLTRGKEVDLDQDKPD